MGVWLLRFFRNEDELRKPRFRKLTEMARRRTEGQETGGKEEKELKRGIEGWQPYCIQFQGVGVLCGCDRLIIHLEAGYERNSTHRSCIVGGGPAGVVLALLLARQGIDVIVLEKHKDFNRDFRGDTIHGATLRVMQELDLLDALLQVHISSSIMLSLHWAIAAT